MIPLDKVSAGDLADAESACMTLIGLHSAHQVLDPQLSLKLYRFVRDIHDEQDHRQAAATRRHIAEAASKATVLRHA